MADDYGRWRSGEYNQYGDGPAPSPLPVRVVVDPRRETETRWLKIAATVIAIATLGTAAFSACAAYKSSQAAELSVMLAGPVIKITPQLTGQGDCQPPDNASIPVSVNLSNNGRTSAEISIGISPWNAGPDANTAKRDYATLSEIPALSIREWVSNVSCADLTGSKAKDWVVTVWIGSEIVTTTNVQGKDVFVWCMIDTRWSEC